MKKTNKTFWQEFSTEYEKLVGEKGDINHELVINPIVFNLLGNLGGRVVLDTGCGNGYLSRKMAKSASKVYGIDFTESFIKTAKERSKNFSNLEFILGDLEELPFPNEMFDVILCNMVLINVENLQVVVKELARVLKAKGTLVVSITHPCFENPPNTYSLKDDKGKTVGRVTKSYFSTGLTINTEDRNQFHYHYQVSDYLNTFSDNNLFLKRAVEPNGAEIMKNNDKDIAPTFLIMKFSKVVLKL